MKKRHTLLNTKLLLERAVITRAKAERNLQLANETLNNAWDIYDNERRWGK